MKKIILFPLSFVAVLAMGCASPGGTSPIETATTSPSSESVAFSTTSNEEPTSLQTDSKSSESGFITSTEDTLSKQESISSMDDSASQQESASSTETSESSSISPEETSSMQSEDSSSVDSQSEESQSTSEAPSFEPATIVSVEGGELDQDGRKVYMFVEPGTVNVSLAGLVSVSPNSRWKLYRGETEIPIKTATTKDGSLIDGDNLFYIVVSSADGLIENVYELTIYRSYSITISYVFHGQVIGTDTANTGYEFDLPETYPINGYSFSHWTYDGNATAKITPWGDVSFEAVASANTYRIDLDANGGDVSDDYVIVTFDSSYSIPTPTRLGYEFLGWYAEGSSTSFSQQGIWSISRNISLKASWRAIAYSISYSLDGGTNYWDNPSSYTVEDTISFFNPSKSGYTFLGWFDASGNKVTSIQKGSIGNVSLTARWNDGNTYTVTLDPNGGTLSQTSVVVQFDHDYSLPTPSKLGYEFSGWYDGDSEFSGAGTWNLATDMSLAAHWSIISYSISYDLAGGTNAASNPESYTIEDDILLSEPTKTGYTFQGWYDSSDNKVVTIQKGTTGDLSLTSRWSANLYSLSVMSEDENKGSAAIIEGSGYTDGSMTVVATPLNGYLFKGWFADGVRVSNKETYTFAMPPSNYSLVAKFWTEEEKNWSIAHGAVPTLSKDGKTITYGLYPQTHVSDAETISSLNAIPAPESNGWFFLDGEYYAKKPANPYESGYKYSDGSSVTSGSSDWFLCEPIKWKVLSQSNGEAFVVSGLLLDAHRYNEDYGGLKDGHYANNYKYSEIRQWLNGDFYDSAFSLDSSSVLTTDVDNSASTTDSDTNPYACENTQDKVFLLSYKDYFNESYGFSNSKSGSDIGKCKLTDWVMASGAIPYEGYSGYYYTRSPHSGYSRIAWSVHGYDGYVHWTVVGRDQWGARPGIRLEIASVAQQ